MAMGHTVTSRTHDRRLLPFAFQVTVSALACLLTGCASLRVTDPARTATEQFLLSEAAKKAVQPLSFEALHARRVYVDSTYFTSVDKDFVLGELRAQLLMAGVLLAAQREDAEIILEVRSAAVGIDRYESLLGIPALGGSTAAVAGGPIGPSVVTPEVALTKTIRQIGYASMAYVAYWSDTGQVMASSNLSVGQAYREDWWLLGMGPSTLGTIPTVDHKRDDIDNGM
ncbi:MAG TPA: hypothetical protein ENN87_03550 [Phycisphaerales bacterium]|nr:hypothetical protein [Phycisphaerales bacterium]